MRGKTAGWMLFVGCLLLLSFASTTRFSHTADLALIGLRLALLTLLSVLYAREQWKHYRKPQAGNARADSDAGSIMLKRARRWFYDEQEPRA